MVDAGPDGESPMRPVENTSSWTFNWINVIPVLLIAVIAVLAWRWLEGTAGFSQGDDAATVPSATKAPDDAVRIVSTTVARVSTTPARPTTTPSTVTATERRVLIRGEMKPCQFGSACLVASFTIEGFDEHPGRFVCIYPNSRSEFGFGDDGVDDACLTADAGDTITIEVDVVRSETISESDLDGPP